MKRRGVIFITVLALLCLFLGGINVGAVIGPIVKTATEGMASIKSPVITDKYIVWHGKANAEDEFSSVYKFDLETEETVILSTKPESYPFYFRDSWVGDNFVSWVYHNSRGFFKLYGANLETNTEFAICHPESIHATYGNIWSNYCFFLQYFSESNDMKSGLYLVDLNSPDEQKLVYEVTNKAGDDFVSPMFNSGIAAWIDDGKFYVYDVEKDELNLVSEQAKTPSGNISIVSTYACFIDVDGAIICYDNNLKETMTLQESNDSEFYFNRNPGSHYIMFEETNKSEGVKNYCAIIPGEEKKIVATQAESFPLLRFSTRAAIGEEVIWSEYTKEKTFIYKLNLENGEKIVLIENDESPFSENRELLTSLSMSENGNVAWARSINIMKKDVHPTSFIEYRVGGQK